MLHLDRRACLSEPRNDQASAPSRDQPGGRTALVIIDMINDLDFAGGDDVLGAATAAAARIADLRARAERADVPVICANDNFGRWHSEHERLVDHAA